MDGVILGTHGRYVGIKTTVTVANTAGDHFKDEIVCTAFFSFLPRSSPDSRYQKNISIRNILICAVTKSLE